MKIVLEEWESGKPPGPPRKLVALTEGMETPASPQKKNDGEVENDTDH